MAKKVNILHPPKVYIVGDRAGTSATAKMFVEEGWNLAEYVADAALIQFQGGQDICPMLYNETPIKNVSFNAIKDKMEIAIYRFGILDQIPMAGICRGGQLLHVLCGGKLWQDVDNHTSGRHPVFDIETKSLFEANSYHHQAMRFNINSGKILLVANESTRLTKGMTGGKEYTEIIPHKIRNKSVTEISPEDGDIEALFYQNQKVLCFQPHPEYANTEVLRKWYFDYLARYLNRSAK